MMPNLSLVVKTCVAGSAVLVLKHDGEFIFAAVVILPIIKLTARWYS